MSRSNEIMGDVIDILRGLGTEPTSLYAVGVPMVAKGATQDEVLNVIVA
jgi:hypothetical protein